METIQAFLKEYDHIPPEEKCMALLLAEERFLKIKQAMEEEQNQPKVEQEEPAAQNFLINLNFPMADDDEYTVIYRKPKSSVENLVPILSEFKGIFEDICDVPFCDNDHSDAECGLINSLLSRDILITSLKIDFLPEEFDEDEILCEKLLNVNLLINKIEALNLTLSTPFVLKNPSSSPILVVDSDFLVEEVDTFLVPEDSIPSGIESDLLRMGYRFS
ncbi:hypothetical protein Tco_0858078 [Tanacetum coccineum]|uniref:Reverse transcriptase domain-containing protein n=1 Tax=Tanacetum coccineum TaxID=301880 RepID=A0ABQ5B8X1_9ASTR